MTVEATKEGPDVLALATVLDEELEAAKLQDTVDQKPESKAVAKVKKLCLRPNNPLRRRAWLPSQKPLRRRRPWPPSKLTKDLLPRIARRFGIRSINSSFYPSECPNVCSRKEIRDVANAVIGAGALAAAGSSVASCSFNLF
jgi:hypothetical protein